MPKKLLSVLLALIFIISLLGGNVMAQENKNIILGLTPKVCFGEDISQSYYLLGEESADYSPLTDGKYSKSANYANKEYVTFYRGKTREIVFELEEVMAITGFRASFLSNYGAGIYCPRFIKVYVSENGVDYMTAYSLADESKTGNPVTRTEYYEVLNGARFKAKYVKIEFDVLVNVFCDELEIYGEAPDGSEEPFKKDDDTVFQGYDRGAEGYRDMVVLYCGYDHDAASNKTYSSEYVNATEEMLLPYVAYLDKDGNIKDTMFDSAVYCSLQGLCPSGGKLYYQNGSYNTKEDWETFAHSVFSDTYNASALNSAVGKVKETLGRPEYKLRLVVAMPYAYSKQDRDFGDINGDGIPEKGDTPENRLAIYKWYMDYVCALFEEKGYENLELGGFYWTSESVTYTEMGSDIPFMRSVADYCREKGKKLFWIPFYLAAGFEDANDLFDTAFMQPNYSFLSYAKQGMFTSFANTINKYGMGIEMELHWDIGNPSDSGFNEAVKRYRAYLNYGYITGYMTGAAHAYYQNAAPGTFYTACKSTNETLRAVYDDTYKFIKGTYEYSSPSIFTETEERVTAGSRLVGMIRGWDKNTEKEFIIEAPPAHGTLKIDNTYGKYTYVADGDYAGADRFTVKMYDGYTYSNSVTVNITVKPAAETEKSDASEQIEKPPASSNKLLWITAAVGAALGVAAVTAVILKKKRK